MSNFPTANEARNGSRNNIKIHAEIRAIEEAIYQAIQAGDLEANVNTSPLTDPLNDDSRIAYSVLFDNLNDREIRDIINQTQNTFKVLGYQITPKMNRASETTFYWEILW